MREVATVADLLANADECGGACSPRTVVVTGCRSTASLSWTILLKQNINTVERINDVLGSQ